MGGGSDGSDKDSSLTTALNDTRQYGLDGSETCSAALSGMSSVCKTESERRSTTEIDGGPL